MKKVFVAALAASALAAFTVLPANAAPWSNDRVVVNNFLWDMSLSDSQSFLRDGEFVEVVADPNSADYPDVDGVSYNSVYGDTVDNIIWDIWNDSEEGVLNPTCDSADKVTDTATGDIVITCTPAAGFDLSGDGSDMVDYVTEYHIFNEGAQGAQIRVSLILTNNDDHAIDFGWELNQSFGECEAGLTATGNGDTDWDLNDGWVDCASDGTWSNSQVVYGGEAPVTYAYGHADAADFPENLVIDEPYAGEPDDGNYVWSDEDADSQYSSIAVGETQIFSYFLATVNGPEIRGAYTADLEQQLADYSDCAYSDGLGTRLLAGLDATPENWVDGGANCELAPAPALAETGVDATAGLGFGALALAAGGAIVVARRRRNA